MFMRLNAVHELLDVARLQLHFPVVCVFKRRLSLTGSLQVKIIEVLCFRVIDKLPREEILLECFVSGEQILIF